MERYNFTFPVKSKAIALPLKPSYDIFRQEKKIISVSQEDVKLIISFFKFCKNLPDVPKSLMETKTRYWKALEWQSLIKEYCETKKLAISQESYNMLFWISKYTLRRSRFKLTLKESLIASFSNFLLKLYNQN